MDFLDGIVIPHSPDDLILIKYLLGLSWLLLIPFVTVVLGITAYSIIMNRKGISENNSLLIQVSNSIIEIITEYKAAWFVLGIIPLISIGFSYMQLLNNTETGIMFFAVIAVFLLVDCAILIFAYQYAFKLKGLFDKVNTGMFNTEGLDDQSKKDVNAYRNRLSKLYDKTSKLGVTFLIVTVYLLAVIIDISFDQSKWSGDSSLLVKAFSLNIILNFLQFIASSFAVGAVVILYQFYQTKKEILLNTENGLRKNLLAFGIIFLLAQPLLIVLKIMTLPEEALSYYVFLFGIINLAFVFLLIHLIYRMLLDIKLNYSASLLFILIFFFSFSVIADQVAFGTSAQKHEIMLAKNFEVYKAEIDKKHGVAEAPLNGEDIYKRVCSACHQFDNVIVGPAHKDVLPKYEGKMDALVDYILNPVKVDPKFTVMPKQPINIKEAEAVAAYLMELYNSKK